MSTVKYVRFTEYFSVQWPKVIPFLVCYSSIKMLDVRLQCPSITTMQPVLCAYHSHVAEWQGRAPRKIAMKIKTQGDSNFTKIGKQYRNKTLTTCHAHKSCTGTYHACFSAQQSYKRTGKYLKYWNTIETGVLLSTGSTKQAMQFKDPIWSRRLNKVLQ